MAVLQHIPWITKLLRYLPGSTKSIDVLRNHATARVNKRLIEGSHAKDLYSYFVRTSSISRVIGLMTARTVLWYQL